MQNSYVICSLARMLAKTSEGIELMVNSTNETDQQAPALSEVCEEMILDELAHVQIITLELTKMLGAADEGSEPESEHADESAFAEGELTSEIPKKED